MAASESVSVNTFESKASSLPARNAFSLDKSSFVKYIDPKFGWLRVGDQLTGDGLTFYDVKVKGIPVSELDFGDYEYYVFAEFIGRRYVNQDEDKEKVIAYALVSRNSEVVIVSISNVSYYARKIANVDTTASELILGLSLPLKSAVNKVYYGADDMYTDRGFRDNGDIRILPSSRISSIYLRILTNDDLKTWYDYFNAKYFDNKLSSTAQVKWVDGDYSYTHCYLVEESNSEAAIAVKDHRAEGVVIHLSRPFLIALPEFFYEVFLHQMIHAFGVPIEHNAYNTFFAQQVARINSLIPGVMVRNYDENQPPYEGKWSGVGYLYQYHSLRGEESNCKLFCSCGNPLYSMLNGVYVCESCGKEVTFKGGDA